MKHEEEVLEKMGYPTEQGDALGKTKAVNEKNHRDRDGKQRPRRASIHGEQNNIYSIFTYSEDASTVTTNQPKFKRSALPCL